MLSFAGWRKLATIGEVGRVQLRLGLLPADVRQDDFQSSHELGGDNWTQLLCTVHTQCKIVIVIVTIITINIIITFIRNINVDKVVLRLYEGVKGDHLEV